MEKYVQMVFQERNRYLHGKESAVDAVSNCPLGIMDHNGFCPWRVFCTPAAMFIAFVRGGFADGTRTFNGGITLPPVLIGVYGVEHIREFSFRS